MPKRNFFLFCLFFSVNIFFGFLAIYLGKDLNWDLRNYHYYNGYAFLKDLSFYNIAPAQVQSFFNPFLDVLYYVLISKLPQYLVAFLLGFLQTFNFWFLFLISFHFLEILPFKKRFFLAFFSSILSLYTPIFLSELGGTMGDSLLSSLVIFSLYCFMVAKNSIFLFFAGFLLGLISGLKYTFMTYSLVLVLVFILFNRREFLRLKFFSIVLGLFFGFLVSDGYWIFLLYKNYKNPFFPFFNHIFKSPYVIESSIKDPRWVVQNVREYFMLPLHFFGIKYKEISELSFCSPSVPVALFFSILYIISSVFLKKRNLYEKKLLFLSVFYVFSFALWGYYFSYYRYVIVLEILSPMLILFFFFFVLQNVPFWRNLLTIVFVLLLFITTKIPNWGRYPWDTKDYFGVRPSAAFQVHNALILMTSYDAFSYIIPYFSGDNRFVRLESLMNYIVTALWWQKIDNIIFHSKKTRYLLCPFNYISSSQKILSKYNLKILSSSCQTISTYLDQFSFCRLEKNQNK